jgi:hypothetical protein
MFSETYKIFPVDENTIINSSSAYFKNVYNDANGNK